MPDPKPGSGFSVWSPPMDVTSGVVTPVPPVAPAPVKPPTGTPLYLIDIGPDGTVWVTVEKSDPVPMGRWVPGTAARLALFQKTSTAKFPKVLTVYVNGVKTL